ncbi:unnamed protein product [Spirodela intermedia]|uniref:Uncharacterized protein n=1 Tax=Spirodela intermedia TaxID=51605 RepID=A0A7I8K6B8_SPIIN|nr:unnamed protein product [Spirodela intermedia]
MDSFFQSRAFGARSWSYESLKNFAPIDAVVQNHLKSVYLTLCLAVVSSAAGAYLHILSNIGGTLTTLGCMLCVAWLVATPAYEERKRFGLLLASSLLQGATLGPIIQLAIDFDPRILVTALVGTAVVFVCFSAAALVAKRRQFLFLGGLLSSGLSLLLWLHFASSIFGGSTAMFNTEIYLGLLVFLGYVLFDTQLIIERARSGSFDRVGDALHMYTNLVAVFIRVLIIMLKNGAEKEKKKKKRSQAS